MSNHFSGKNLAFPEDDARLDLTDVFAFSSPADLDRIVLIMDANTFATGSEFHPDAVYQLLVDTNNDNEPDVTFSAVFSEPQAGAQSVTLYRATGAEAGDMEPKGEVIIESSPVSFDSDVEVAEAGPFRFFAGRRSDPFFADVDGLLHNFQWTGADLFGDKDIFSIAMEMPNDVLGEQSEIGVWARINLRRNGDLVQIDRGGHPSLTAFSTLKTLKRNTTLVSRPATGSTTCSRGRTCLGKPVTPERRRPGR
ncbi:MAG TPA: DUF4331 family protein [Propionibacteriaceae bacterium]